MKRENSTFINELKKSHERILLVGSGTFGDVYAAEEISSKEMVAIKRMKIPSGRQAEMEAHQIVLKREQEITKKIGTHPNIMSVRGSIEIDGASCILMDYMHHDLGGLIENSKHFPYGQLKCYAKQLATGIAFLHASGVLHRDLKPANILVSKNHLLKITDFGLACFHAKGKQHEDCEVVSLWYRAPELLMRSRDYGFEIDVWSYGCILVEMLQKTPLFAGKDPFEQAQLIYELLGTPWTNGWPESRKLPQWIRQENGLSIPRQELTKHFKNLRDKVDTYHFFTKEVIHLINRLFAYRPESRILMQDVVNHPYFTVEKPTTCLPEQLPRTEKSFYSTLIKKK